MDRYPTAQERQAFARIFKNLCYLGWDLPSHHAHALMDIRTHGPRTLEQEVHQGDGGRDSALGTLDSPAQAIRPGQVTIATIPRPKGVV